MHRTRRVIVVILTTFLAMYGMSGIAHATQAPGACDPDEEGFYDVDPDGLLYRCICLRSTSTGLKRCRWAEQETVATSNLHIGAEWSTSGQLTYGETARTPSGYFRSFGEVAHYVGDYASNLPAGWLAAATVVQRWNGSAWTDCRDSGFYYSSGSWAWMNVTYRFGSAPCGDGYYSTYGYGFVWDGGRWRGNPGGVWSGYMHWSGCPQCLTVEPPAPPSQPPPTVDRAPKLPPGKRPAHSHSPNAEFIVTGS